MRPAFCQRAPRGDPATLLRALQRALPTTSQGTDKARWELPRASRKTLVQVSRALARTAARHSDRAFLIGLQGPLGSGKTSFVRALAGELGIPKSEIHSPTFAYLDMHLQGRVPLYHFDLYRLSRARDFDELGFAEYLELPGISCLEWADRLWPRQESVAIPHLSVQLQFLPGAPHLRSVILRVAESAQIVNF